MTQINTASMNIQSSPIQHIKRINELDFLKCIGIILVVIGHVDCPQKLHDLIYYVHMPLFFMLSGCTNKEDQYYASVGNLKAFFIKRIKSIYLPFLYYSLPIILLHNVFYNLGMYSSGYTLTQYIVQVGRTFLFSIGTSEPLLGQFWFLKALFIAEIIYSIFVFLAFKINISKWVVILPISFFALFVDLDLIPHSLVIYFFIPFRALLYYSVGSYFVNIVNKRTGKWFLILSVLGCILWIFFSLYNVLKVDSFVSIHSAYGISSFLQLYATVSVFIILWRITHYINETNILYKTCLVVGRMSMPIFAFHYLFVKLLSYFIADFYYHDIQMISNVLCLSVIPWYVYTIVGVSFSILLYKVLFILKKYIVYRYKLFCIIK